MLYSCCKLPYRSTRSSFSIATSSIYDSPGVGLSLSWSQWKKCCSLAWDFKSVLWWFGDACVHESPWDALLIFATTKEMGYSLHCSFTFILVGGAVLVDAVHGSGNDPSWCTATTLEPITSGAPTKANPSTYITKWNPWSPLKWVE